MLAPDQPEALHGLFNGIVTHVDDPVKAGRVRIRIPGVVEESTAWAIPMSFGGGGPQRGVHWVPPLGAQVGVMFLMGDADRPVYVGIQSLHGTFLSGTDGDPNTMALETAGYVIAIDDRPGSKNLTIKDKEAGVTIQLNGEARSIAIEAVSDISLRSRGFIRIDALEVFVNGVQAGLGKL